MADDIKDLEQKVAKAQDDLAKAQTDLAEAKKKATVDAARQAVLDAIQTQRAAAQAAVTAAQGQHDQWDVLIGGKLPQEERDKLKDEIEERIKGVTNAQAAVTTLADTVAADETALKAAEDALAAKEREYAETQKQLGKLAAAIKDAQKEADQLRGETLAAINAEAWRRAFYKNYRLNQAIGAAQNSLDPAKAQQDLLDALTAAEGEIKTMRTDAAAARQKLDKDKADQKTTIQDAADKAKGLETAIANFL